jgi:quinol monooxygenase YgiN
MRQSLHLMLALIPLWLAGAPAARAQDANDPIRHMVRYVEVAPASRQQVAGLLKQLADASRKEAGVLSFEVTQRTSPAHQFAIIETWKDQQALDAHAGAAHRKFADAVQPLLIAPIDDRLCIAIDVAPAKTISRNARFVLTHVDVGPPSRDAGIALLKTVTGPSRKENGSVAFDALQQTARTNHFEVLEIWEDQKALDAHEISQSTKDYRTKVQPLLGAHYDQRVYEPL